MWQPIETAPMDGTEILCLEGDARYVGAYRLWFQTTHEPPQKHYAWFATRGPEDHFYGSDGFEPIEMCNLKPTQWQPLPDRQ